MSLISMHHHLNITGDVDLGVVRELECLDASVNEGVSVGVALLPVSNQFWHSKNQFDHEHKMRVSDFHARRGEE